MGALHPDGSSVKRRGGIIRNRKERDYASIDNALLEDSSLSWKARGILAYLISRPRDWQVRMGDLIARSKDGRVSVRAGIQELIAAGYIHREQERDQKGRLVDWIYEVYETPKKPKAGFPPSDNRPFTKTDGKAKRSLKRSKATAFSNAEGLCPEIPEKEHPAEWIPDTRTKAQKLASIQVLKGYPSEQVFEQFVLNEELDHVANYRENLYSDLCDRKWCHWNDELQKWVRIREWKKYVRGLNEKILSAND